MRINTLLNNLLFILLPLFVFQLYLADKIRLYRRMKVYSMIGSIVVMLLCMSYPIIFIPGHAFDLRQIPFILLFLYVGRVPGTILFLVLIVYRTYMGGDGIYIAFVVNAIMYGLLFVLEPKFSKRSLKGKVMVLFLLSSFKPIAILLYMQLFYEVDQFLVLFTGQIFVFQTTGLLLTMHFIERMKMNFRMQERVKQAEKREVVSDLAASFAHEIRNPLTVTKGFVQLLQQPGIPQVKKTEFMKLALGEIDNAERIITNYLSYAKPALENVEKLDIYRVVEQSCLIMQPYSHMHGAQIMFETSKAVEPLYILGQAQTFKQCMTNVLKNCIEAMPDGGTISVNILEEKKNIYIRITDEGVGMSEEKLARLGEPYFSTKEKGTGLGMMVVYNIVHAMGGELEVESAEGKGSSFLFCFSKASENQKILSSLS